MSKSIFEKIPVAPVDPILGTSIAFRADTDAKKINLGVGAYRTEEGKPYILPVVREAEEELLVDLGVGVDKEYQTIDGPPELKTVTQKLVFGDKCEAFTSKRIASVQALSGTGALRVAAEFAKEHMPDAKEVWVSDPTWGNHNAIFKRAGLTVKTYPYWHEPTKGLNFEGMMNALETEAAPGSMILLHACAHNPTGVDPTRDQWEKIAEVMQRRNLFPLMDSAYQGYASGDLDYDAWAFRFFVEKGFEMMLCQSFAKNLGLYGERAGMLHIVCGDSAQADAVLSQLKLVIRPMYSSPPCHAAQLVVKILGNEARLNKWRIQLKEMADRILEVRKLLREGLEAKGTPGKWNHITDQIGMFSFTGLTKAQCQRLTMKHHIYLLDSGRISLAGLNKGNIQYMIDCTDEAVRAAS